MAKTLLEQFQFNLKVMRLFSKICGADVLDPNYRVNFITWTVVAIICFYFSTIIYTIYAAFVANDEWSHFLLIICMSGSGVQGASKLFSGLAYRDSVLSIIRKLLTVYEDYQPKRDGYKLALQRSVNLLTKVTAVQACAYFVLCSTLLSFSLYLHIFHNRKEFVTHFAVPGIDPNTDNGFIMLTAIHFTVLLFGSFGNFAADMYFITVTTHLPLMKDILRCKFEDLNVVVANETNNGESSMELLRDIFTWHQSYIRFINIIKEAYFFVIIVQIVSLAYSIGCTLFCLLLGKWPIGIVYLIYCFIMLYIYCGLGTLVEIANDGIIDSCYNDSLWYKYSVKEQKMLQIMLRMSQNTTGLTVGAVYPLSISTGLQVTKTIYTFTMMLINFLN